VFENGEEFIVKHVNITVPVRDEVTGNGSGGDDWNLACEGYMKIDRETSTANIGPTPD
jgi:hypothetical protein